MSGFLLAGIAAFLWSLVNIIDKALIERFCKIEGTGALLILSALFPAVLLPISYFFAEQSIIVSFHDVAILIFSGFLVVAWIALYFNALLDDDVSVVMPMMQLVPVFAFIFGYLLLNELPSGAMLLAGLVIVIGSLVLSIEQTTGTIKKRLLVSMIAVSAIIALMNTLFKFVTVAENFWVSVFWHTLGIVIVGVVLYLFHSSYRCQFHQFIKSNWGIGLSLNAVNESLTLGGDLLFAYAILLAPLALVQTMEGYQPLFVFLMGLIITKISPNILNENVTKPIIIQKGIGIALVIVGSVWLLGSY
jgi:uncharacterized membrane protein